MVKDTDPIDLDGDTPLTPRELEHIRRVLRDDDRATWARKKLQVLVPLIVMGVTAVWQAWEFLAKHVKVSP